MWKFFLPRFFTHAAQLFAARAGRPHTVLRRRAIPTSRSQVNGVKRPLEQLLRNSKHKSAILAYVERDTQCDDGFDPGLAGMR